MHSNYAIRSGILAAVVAIGYAAPVFAAPTVPMPVHQGHITYITGGIGDDEQQAMEASAHDYNLLISNAEKDGSFTAGTNLVIRDAKGQEVLQTHNTGPLFYAQLPPGDYVVDATFNGVERVRDVSVKGSHPAELHLIWPQMAAPQYDWRRG
jgi:hypothetical protein